MRIFLLTRAEDQYVDAPLAIRRSFDQKLKFLRMNLRHPSLRAKKYAETNDVWQARITRGWRFYFQIENDTYIILSLMRHPK